MAHAANDDWSRGELVAVPHAWRGDRLWSEIQAETQYRIGADLRALYAGLLRQPLSPRLVGLARDIEARLEASRHGG